jgi:dolichyl-phosphate-mannose-protein mannosyltransferase
VNSDDRRGDRWFWPGLVGIFAVSLGLRFWGLGRFNTLVFDEVYYAKFANNYLTGTPFFDGHPPLSKYIIAIGMGLGDKLPIGRDITNTLTGSLHSTWSYRWLNALTGSFIPLVIAALAYQLQPRRSFALVAGLLAAADGLFLVESRYALNNVYLVIFGLLGQLCCLLAVRSGMRAVRPGDASDDSSADRPLQPKPLIVGLVWLLLSGICFGATVSIKWNGLWFWLGTLVLWAIAVGQWGWALWTSRSATDGEQLNADRPAETGEVMIWQAAARLDPLAVFLGLLTILLFLLIVPAVAYYLFWLPHLHFNPKDTFLGLQQQILTYHQGVGRDVHPYCSSWQSWLLMLRPVAYFYKRDIDPRQLLPLNGPTASVGPIYDVHSMGNPMLWWSSTAAIGLLLGLGIGHLWRQIRRGLSRPGLERQPPLLAPSDAWVVLFLGVNFGANLLPWIPVNRCIYLYHYMGSSVYALLGLAWLCDRWLRSGRAGLQLLGQGVITLAVMGLIFWLPIYLGLPLPGETYRWRMWLDSWI